MSAFEKIKREDYNKSKVNIVALKCIQYYANV